MSLLSAAIDNNATWCDAVCRALGCDTARLDGLWVNRSTAPPYYSNAVTLGPIDAAVQLARVRSMVDSDLRRPWTIKDSMRRLDLTPLGFETLFDADWIGLDADRRVDSPDASGSAWVVATHDADLAAWERAWRTANPDAASAGLARLFQPELLDDPDIRFLAKERDGRIEAVVAANRSDDGTGPVVGMSNMVAVAADPTTAGSDAVAAVQAAFPGLPVVGYEREQDLVTMLDLGFRSLGSLRVWLIPG
jgi:hypothetical protein